MRESLQKFSHEEDFVYDLESKQETQALFKQLKEDLKNMVKKNSTNKSTPSN